MRKAQELYQTHNIIGSTSAPNQPPTVYYRTNSGTFGRITQEHKHPHNIGREPPSKNPNYSMGNTGPGGVLEEKIGDKVFHKSRNPFVPARTDEDREALSQAQQNFPHFKSKTLNLVRNRKR